MLENMEVEAEEMTDVQKEQLRTEAHRLIDESYSEGYGLLVAVVRPETTGMLAANMNQNQMANILLQVAERDPGAFEMAVAHFLSAKAKEQGIDISGLQANGTAGNA